MVLIKLNKLNKPPGRPEILRTKREKRAKCTQQAICQSPSFPHSLPMKSA
jgi:hypothetical protein